MPLPYVDEHAAELLFRHKVMSLLQGEGLLSEERTRLLLSWRHTGFSVHTTPETAVVAVGMGVEEGGWLPYGHPLVPAGLGGGLGEHRVRVEPEDGAAVERLARYIMRPPISLERLEWDGSGAVR